MSTALVPFPRPQQSCIRKCIFASRYLEQAYKRDDVLGNPKARIWVVKAGDRVRKETGKGWGVWVDPVYLEESKVYSDSMVNWAPELDNKRGSYDLSMGRPMMEFCVRVPLCVGEDRPRLLVSTRTVPGCRNISLAGMVHELG